MKKEYSKPQIEIEILNEEDIVTTSTFDQDGILAEDNVFQWDF